MGNKKEDKKIGASIQMVKHQNNRSSMDRWVDYKFRENREENIIKEIRQECLGGAVD